MRCGELADDWRGILAREGTACGIYGNSDDSDTVLCSACLYIKLLKLVSSKIINLRLLSKPNMDKYY